MAKSFEIILCDINDCTKTITLPDRETVAIGRNRYSRIMDLRCSRTHLMISSNFDERTVIVEQCGWNSSSINGVKLNKGEKRKIYENDIIEIVEKGNCFKLLFCSKDEKPSCSKRNKSEDNSGNDEISCKTNYCTSTLDHFLKDSIMKSEGVWKSVHQQSLVIFSSNKIESKEKIASFDLDGTIINTVSGNVFAKDLNDWKIAFPNVSEKLKVLHEKNYKVVLFTNQSGIGRGKIKLADFKKKVEAIIRKLCIPVQVFIATMDNIHRKPRPGMWEFLVENENDNLDISYEESFFCGDAAGRPANCKLNKKKDFSVSDRLFALNLNLKFFTPEEYFLDQKVTPFVLPQFNPSLLSENASLLEPVTSKLVSKNQELILMIGCPGSGKSFFAEKYLETAGYIRVNRDILKTWQKCVNLTQISLQSKSSVVVDNTNTDKESRARYINIAKQFHIPVRAFWMKTTLEHAKHNNTFRQIKKDNSHDFIPNHSLNNFFNLLETPVLEEGFAEIVRVNFIPQFTDESDKKLYNMYLLD